MELRHVRRRREGKERRKKDRRRHRSTNSLSAQPMPPE